jgi:hypothetical protein
MRRLAPYASRPFGIGSTLDPEEVHEFLVSLGAVEGPWWTPLGTLCPAVECCDPAGPAWSEWAPLPPAPWAPATPEPPTPTHTPPPRVPPTREERSARAKKAARTRARNQARQQAQAREYAAEIAAVQAQQQAQLAALAHPTVEVRWASAPIFEVTVDRSAPWGHTVLGRRCITAVDQPVCTCGIHALTWAP